MLSHSSLPVRSLRVPSRTVLYSYRYLLHTGTVGYGTNKETSVWPSSFPDRRPDEVIFLSFADHFREPLRVLEICSRQFSQINLEERSATSVIPFATANETPGLTLTAATVGCLFCDPTSRNQPDDQKTDATESNQRS